MQGQSGCRSLKVEYETGCSGGLQTKARDSPELHTGKGILSTPIFFYRTCMLCSFGNHQPNLEVQGDEKAKAVKIELPVEPAQWKVRLNLSHRALVW